MPALSFIKLPTSALKNKTVQQHILFFFGHTACGNLRSPTRDQTQAKAVNTPSPKQWPTRELPYVVSLVRPPLPGARATLHPQLMPQPSSAPSLPLRQIFF